MRRERERLARSSERQAATSTERIERSSCTARLPHRGAVCSSRRARAWPIDCKTATPTNVVATIRPIMTEADVITTTTTTTTASRVEARRMRTTIEAAALAIHTLASHTNNTINTNTTTTNTVVLLN